MPVYRQAKVIRDTRPQGYKEKRKPRRAYGTRKRQKAIEE
jgi:hypothetical protein